MDRFPLPVDFREGAAVAALPPEIDITNADTVSDTLLALLGRGTPLVIADMTGTRFCDVAGMRAILRAHYRARALGGRLDLVVADPAALRVFTVTGTSPPMRVHARVDSALARAARDRDRPADSNSPWTLPSRRRRLSR